MRKLLNLYQRTRKPKINAKTSKVIFSKRLTEPLDPHASIVHSADLDVITPQHEENLETRNARCSRDQPVSVSSSKPKPPDATSDRITLDF